MAQYEKTFWKIHSLTYLFLENIFIRYDIVSGAHRKISVKCEVVSG